MLCADSCFIDLMSCRVFKDPTNTKLTEPHTGCCSGGGGLVSTIGDCGRFVRMLLNKGQLDGKKVLGRKTVELMMQDHLPEGVAMKNILHVKGGMGFGLGGSVVLNPAANGHPGSKGTFSWGGAANTYYCVDPEEGIGFVMMTQIMPSFDLCVWRRQVHALVLAALV